MCSSEAIGGESILRAINRRAIPALAGAMIFVTGVAVVLGWLALYGRSGGESLAASLAGYVWIVFWTGLAEGLALLTGIFVFSFAARRITRPLTRLSETVARLSRGGGTAAFDTQGPIREINQLSAAFGDLFASRERQARELRELTRNVLHDLRTPLAHIRHSAELVHDGKAEAVPMMEVVAEACNTVLDIVDTNSEISANYSDSDPTPADILNLSAVITTLAEMYAAVAENCGVAFSVSLPQAPISFVGHKHKLQRMIGNLLDNAFKFTPRGGSVALTADRVGNAVVLEVSDTGVGIPEDERKHVFERFYRGKSARQKPGNGLGLSLVHAITTFYRGTLTCCSEEGRGTTFAVRLPLSSGAASLART